MSVTKNKKQASDSSSKEVRGPLAAATRNSARKAPGTRVGTIEDWRAAGSERAGEQSAHGKRLRDGR